MLLASEKCEKEVLFKDHKVSIEPTTAVTTTSTVAMFDEQQEKQNHDNASLGPAFFAQTRKKHNATEDKDSNDNFDPAMCSFEMTLYSAKLPDQGMTTPLKDAMKRHRTLFGGYLPCEKGWVEDDEEKSGDEVEEQENDVDSEDEATTFVQEAIVIAKIDGKLFQVDFNQIQNVRHNRDIGDNGTSVPPSLILEFPSCWMRIFSMDAESHAEDDNLNMPSAEEGATTFLDIALEKIQRLLANEFLLPFPLKFFGLPHHISTLVTNPSDSKNQSRPEGRSAQQCIESYSKAWEDIDAIEQVLNVHVNGLSHAQQESLRKYINELLSRIPKRVSSSFVTEQVLSPVLDANKEEINRISDAFDEALKPFWMINPSSTTKRSKRKRRRGDDILSPEEDTGVEHEIVVQQECIDRTKEILESHKKALQAKYEISLLPYREQLALIP
jgi:hypothetical protein